ncbi:MAG: dehydrogenase [Rhodospirillaceae bacterium]|nr:dehydrogenase [Rhodospirillaceae bacterium]|tara:strand:- start:745 stop:1503 length:759 start_codon:yes stop_codon:yes gene_type:complete
MGQLDKRTVIVTGAAQGIGAAYARGLVAEGANVVINDVIDPAPLVNELTAAGGDVIGITADVTDDDQIDSMVAKTVEKYGRIDGLINNAALFGKIARRRFEEIDIEEFDAVMRVNIRGVWQVSRAVINIMRNQRYGKVVNIASGTVFKGTPMQLHYVTSKGAIIALSRAMAREVGEDNICINTIAPGLTRSEAVLNEGQFSDEHFDANIGSRCIKRAEEPEDLIGTAVFLLSPDSDFVTGQVLCVDGGSVTH